MALEKKPENAVGTQLTEETPPPQKTLSEGELLEYFKKKSIQYAYDMLKVAGLLPETADRSVIETMAADYLAGAAEMCEQHPAFAVLEDAGGARLRGLAQQLRAVYA